jgi:multiple sugar transport system ATP-binding protein
LVNGVFEALGVNVAGFGSHSQERMVLGIRAEDLTVNAAAGNINGEIFSFELTGDATLVTLKPDTNTAQTITARFDKLYRNTIGHTLSLHASANKCYLFDAKTQGRLRLSTV